VILIAMRQIIAPTVLPIEAERPHATKSGLASACWGYAGY